MKMRINDRIYDINDIDVNINLEPDGEIIRYLRTASLQKEILEIEFVEPFRAMICGMETKLQRNELGSVTIVKFMSLKRGN